MLSSRETVSTDALSAGNNLATALSLNACLYLAILFFRYHPRVSNSIEATTILIQRATPELIVLESADIQLLVHWIPPPFAEGIVITSPPQRREDTALKFFFSVPSLAAARLAARAAGGEVFAENWQGPGFTVCNGMDPEGNVFQVREFAA